MATPIYEQLLAWSEGLQPWQQDALRRVVISDSLSASETQEVANTAYRQALKAHADRLPEPGKVSADTPGVPEDEAVPAPVPLTSFHLPSRSASKPPVRITKARHISGVNRLRPDTSLEIKPDGLNVIFGLNGVGKSGLTRILKSACHSRCPEREVLGNVYESTHTPAVAEITYLLGEEGLRHEWDLAKGSDDVNLPRIAVYDHKSAQVHLKKTGAQVELVPDGLNALTSLITVYENVVSHARGNIAALRATPEPDIRRTSEAPEVRKVLDALGAKCALKPLEDLATLTPGEESERNALPETIRTMGTSTLSSRIAAATHHKRQLSTQNAKWTTVAAAFAQEQIDSLAEADAALVQIAVEETSRTAPDFSGEPLSGVHQAHWQAMWEAALEYAVQDAYPGETYPSQQTTLCVLCQQTLSDEAHARLLRFAEAMQVDRSADKRRLERIAAQIVAGMQASVARDAIDDTLLDTLNEAHREAAEEGRVTVAAARAALERRAAGEPTDAPQDEAAPADDAHGVETQAGSSPAGVSIAQAAKQLATTLGTLAEAQQVILDALSGESDDPETLKARRVRLAVLTERVAVRDAVEDLRALHTRLIEIEAWQEVIDQGSTHSVSRKSTALGNEYIGSICQAFLEDVEALGASGLEVTMKPLSTNKGTRRTGFILTKAALTDAAIEDVLSEGELRVISLAAFLADVRVMDDKSGIILDDPVTSLDHVFQKAVAERLVKEARSRQVTLFTHSNAFVTELVSAVNNDRREQHIDHVEDVAEVAMHYTEITKAPSGSAGIPAVGFITPIRSLKHWMHELENTLLARAKRHYEADEIEEYARAVENFAQHLRNTWESAVEEDLFESIVLRNRRDVQTTKLKAVAGITFEEIAAVDRGMDTESFFDHSTAAGSERALPTPDVLAQKVADLKIWRKMVLDRKKSNASRM